MNDLRDNNSIKIFYSYSHKDAEYRDDMERSLELLKRAGLLEQWHDGKILPGNGIPSAIKEAMDSSEIFVFLLSPDFIASEGCKQEWDYASELCFQSKARFRVPVIVRPCPWKDMLGNDDLKALPRDGKSVSTYSDPDEPWVEVYEGIKEVIEALRTSFEPREEFLKEVQTTEFISQDHINLSELFIFPRLSRAIDRNVDQPVRNLTIDTEEELLFSKVSLIYGQEKSGKTTLARHLFISLVSKSSPVLLVDLKQQNGGLNERFLRRTYEEQFNGDYNLWKTQENKTLILDNVSSAPAVLELIEDAKGIFSRVILTMSTDMYYSYFRDEQNVTDFQVIEIQPLTYQQQEQLIRQRLQLIKGWEVVTDGFVDQVESQVNSVIISNRIVPRYPFYVLSILQTYEAYMPSNVSVSSYGHCYYALIVASLIRAGISKSDDEVNACFNLLERLAFANFLHHKKDNHSHFDFDEFLKDYKEKYFIRTATISRLKHRTYGIISDDGSFKREYTYYFFLGKFLASNKSESEAIVQEMCESTHQEDNFLTLLFIIHHSQDNLIVDDILVRTMCALDTVNPAALNREETESLRNLLNRLPEDILSGRSVAEERRALRERWDDLSEERTTDSQVKPREAGENPANEIYRILKNNKILGQIIRNKYGTLEKSKIEEIISIVADSGLRLVRLALLDEEELTQQVRNISEKHQDWDIPRIRQALEALSFLWTIFNVEMAVEAINVPEVREAVDAVVERASTPAYDLIGYFSLLDGAGQLTNKERNWIYCTRSTKTCLFNVCSH